MRNTKDKIKDSPIGFGDKWVALRSDGPNKEEIIEFGDSIEELETKLVAQGVGVEAKNVALVKVLPSDVAYSPHAQIG